MILNLNNIEILGGKMQRFKLMRQQSEEKKKLENQLHKQSLMNAELTFQRPAIKPAFDSKDSQSKSELETKYDNYGSLSAEIVGKTVQDFLNDEMNREREEQRRMEDKKHN